MTYNVIIEYPDGSYGLYESGLSYQDAFDIIISLRENDLEAARIGVPIMERHYWIELNNEMTNECDERMKKDILCCEVE